MSAAGSLDHDYYLLRHKTTLRSLYDAVLAGLAGSPEVFNAIFSIRVTSSVRAHVAMFHRMRWSVADPPVAREVAALVHAPAIARIRARR